MNSFIQSVYHIYYILLDTFYNNMTLCMKEDNIEEFELDEEHHSHNTQQINSSSIFLER